jgi:hypothetical protein
MIVTNSGFMQLHNVSNKHVVLFHSHLSYCSFFTAYLLSTTLSARIPRIFHIDTVVAGLFNRRSIYKIIINVRVNNEE